MTTATHGDVVGVLSSIFITAQSDTRNIEYLIKLATENKSGTATFWVKCFLRAFSFSGYLLFGKN